MHLDSNEKPTKGTWSQKKNIHRIEEEVMMHALRHLLLETNRGLSSVIYPQI